MDGERVVMGGGGGGLHCGNAESFKEYQGIPFC